MLKELQDENIANINNFIVDNTELDALSDLLEQFNIFDVLGVSQYEIRHSNTLAWLFDPHQHHGYSDKFFRRFLSRVLLESPAVKSGIQPANIELSHYDDLLVYREWRNIDILLVSDSNKICVLFENKVNAKESDGQLKNYFDKVKKHWSNYTIIPIFLTLDGDDPSDEGLSLGYAPVSYIMILDILQKLQNNLRASQSEGIQGFINNYLQIIKRLTMQDKGITELCKSIYSKYKDPIDLIVKYGSVSQVYEACNEALVSSKLVDISKKLDCGFIKEARGLLFFVPDKLAISMREVDLSRWEYLPNKYPICCWFKNIKEKSRLQLSIEIGPVKDYNLRCELLKIFQSPVFNIRSSAHNEGTLYSSVYSQFIDLTKHEGDFEFIKNRACSLLGTMMKELEPLLKNIERCLENQEK